MELLKIAAAFTMIGLLFNLDFFVTSTKQDGVMLGFLGAIVFLFVAWLILIGGLAYLVDGVVWIVEALR